MGRAKIDHVQALLAESAVAAAWRARHGRDANAGDVEALMARLGPLMREHAARASALIPGARAAFDRLRAAGLRVASSTGYTREMMQPVLARAAEQGYVPEHVVCSGETPAGRPSPLMIYKACAELGVWPLSRVVKVDDAEAGIAEGKAAGAFTVGWRRAMRSACRSRHCRRCQRPSAPAASSAPADHCSTRAPIL
jgi:phosphonoacetaldehyde hydrolase